jgi:hypothetical protein
MSIITAALVPTGEGREAKTKAPNPKAGNAEGHIRCGIGCGSSFEYEFRMSKHINVNPGQYKVAGRERPGDDVPAERNKERASMEEHRSREEANGKSRKKQPARNRKT